MPQPDPNTPAWEATGWISARVAGAVVVFGMSLLFSGALLHGSVFGRPLVVAGLAVLALTLIGGVVWLLGVLQGDLPRDGD